MKHILFIGAFMMATAAQGCPDLLNHRMDTLSEEPASLCQYAGKVLLVVNTASECGFTPQYEGLERLYRRYKDRGLMVVGFPSNDFGAQEKGSNKDIAEFCRINYGVSFPMFAKTSVAKAPNPFYAQLARTSGATPAWNFHKYLIDRKGEKAQSFPSAVSPTDPRLIRELERLLADTIGR